MAVAGTEKALTVDANVIGYYFGFTRKLSIPLGLKTKRIKDFCDCVIDRYCIAINRYIRSEYEKVIDFELAKHWIKDRLENDLAIEVDCLPLSKKNEKCLREDYGFDCQSRDSRYLQTCINTIFKHLVTENTEHFYRPHRGRKRRSMPDYLKRELKLTVCTMDRCCSILLNEEDSD